MNSVVNTTLENVCDFIGGSQPAKKYFSEVKLEGYIRLIQIRDYKTDKYVTYIPENSTRKFCNETDIMIGRYGPPIFQILRGITGAYNVALMKAIPKENILNNYLYYFLSQEHLFEYVNALSPRTGGQTGVDVVMLKKYPIQLPDLQTQKAIAKVLSDLDAKIELNNKINAELEAMAKLIYDYWFVQFDFPDPTTSSGQAGKPYKSSGGKMVYNKELKREIPEGWEVKTVGDYCKSSGGFAFKSSMWSEEGALVVKIKDIQEDCTINLSDISHANLKGKEIDRKFISKPGDVLIAMTGATIGKYAIVPFTDKPLYVNQRVGYFDLGNNPTNKLPFLINSLNQKYFRDVVFKIATGAAQPNISNEQINNIKLVTPQKDLLDLYNSKMKSTYDRILNNQRENQQLSELRDWLLPMLMNGQVTVGE